VNQEKKQEREEKGKEEKGLGRLIVSAPPHLRSPEDAPRIMLMVVLALLPVTILALILFKLYALQTILFCIVGAVGAEALIQKLRGIPITINDWSAFLTGLLLALCLPPKVPFWIPLIGGAVAIGLGKQVFGGLGYNVFNPALVGRAVLLMSWANHLTRDWYATLSVEAISGATPLFIAKQVQANLIDFDLSRYYKMLLLQNPHGSMGEVSALLIILGGLFLMWRKVISWHIPLTYVGTVFVLSWLFQGDPIFYILAGGVMFGAVFMATDYVTSPVYPKGKVIFGIGCGLVTTIIRFFSSFPEAVTYAILFMNACTPLIDLYTKPKKFGAVKE
jgi:electron transport complex protein RnfD